jgi:hypothetical protein
LVEYRYVELLKEVVPRLSRVGVLWDADDEGSANGFKEYGTAVHVGHVNETDDAHFSLTFGANERVSFVDFSDEIGPAIF